MNEDHDKKVAEIEATVGAYFDKAPQPIGPTKTIIPDDWRNVLAQANLTLQNAHSIPWFTLNAPKPMTATEVLERQQAATAHANAMAAQQDAYLQQLVAEAMQLTINPPLVVGVDPGAPGGDRMALHHIDGNPRNNHPDNLSPA